MPKGMGYGPVTKGVGAGGNIHGTSTAQGKSSFKRNMAEESDKSIVDKLAKTDQPKKPYTDMKPWDVWSGYIGARSE
jgi:hypothetical protein